MMRYKITETEEKVLEKWLNSRPVKNALKKGAKLSLTFSYASGIGTHVMADVKQGNQNYDELPNLHLSKDITDYESW